MTDYEINLQASLNGDEEKPDKSSKPVLGSEQTEVETAREESGEEQTWEQSREPLSEEPPQTEAESFVTEEPSQAEAEPLEAEGPVEEAQAEAESFAAEEEPEQEYRKKDRPSTAGSAAKGMISFFTILPVDAGEGDIDAMNRNFWLTPVLIGVLYGLLAAISFYIFQWFFGFNLGIMLTMILLIVMNRMLHLDGLMDTADGLTVAGTREDHLRALKDTNVGAGGIVAAIVIIIATLFAYLSFGWVWGAIAVLFVGEVIAKTSQVAAAAFGEPGNGMAGDSVRNTDKDKFILSYLMSIVVCVIWAILVTAISLAVYRVTWSSFDTFFVVSTGLAAAGGPLAGVALANVANKNFGYVNGDVLGASNETGRLAAMLVLLLFMNLLLSI